jgi:replicative DNA helicase
MINYYKTHFTDLDKMLLGGFHPGSLVVIGARPAMGKSTLMRNIYENFSYKENISCNYLLLEESVDRFIFKIISSQSEVEFEKVITQDMSGEEFQRYLETSRRMKLNISSFISYMEKDIDIILNENSEKGVKVVFIDYLQLAIGESNDRYTDTYKLLTYLKRMAVEKGLCIVVSSQLSRKVEERTGHRPNISDLRECGGIEEVADQILFILRREYYDPMDKPGTAQIIIAKNRMGNIGDVTLSFRKDILQFSNYVPRKFCPDDFQP